MRYGVLLSALGMPGLLAGCAAMAPLPNDYQFPTNEILRYAACELRKAYQELDKRNYPNFKADEYTVAVSLQPRVDTELTAKAGLTGNSGTDHSFYNSWALGAALAGGSPGAGIDTRGHQDGKVGYNIRSSHLVDKKRQFPVDCHNWSDASYALAENLDIRSWLIRSTEASLGNIGKLTSVDSQAYTAEIYIKYDVGGGFTYNFPFGTDFATASAKYWRDDFLTISITHTPPEKIIYTNTLPTAVEMEGGKAALTKEGKIKMLWEPTRSSVVTSRPGAISEGTRTRLDLLQLQQSIQNLQISNPR